MGVREWTVIGLVGLAFAPALVGMAEVWATVDYYSHGFLVPAVAIWAAFRKRESLAEAPARPDRRGFAVLGIALLVYAVALIAGGVFLQGMALVVAVAGSVLLLRGPAWLRALSFPIAFLVFMVPMPQPWLTPAILKLQFVVTSSAVGVLDLLAVPVTRAGNVIVLPGGESLFVAGACSGVTSIVTLTPLAVVLAMFTERRPGRRWLLVASVIPIAMATNLLRVVATTIAAHRVGVERATAGLAHDSAGMLTYLLACFALLAVGTLLRRKGGAPEPQSA